jgi:hypothetical protein
MLSLISGEQFIPLSEAAKALHATTGIRPDVEKMKRWGAQGIRCGNESIKLEITFIGDRMLTTMEALQRFIDATTAAKLQHAVSKNKAKSPQPKIETPSRRRVRLAKVERNLTAAGFEIGGGDND